MNEVQRKALDAKALRDARAKARAYDVKKSPSARNGTVYLLSLRKRAEQKGMDFDLTPEWFATKLALESCEATGIKFQGKATDPFGRTIDRKDSSKGYTIENCWATCWIYNRCKLDGSHEDVMRMAIELIKKHVID